MSFRYTALAMPCWTNPRFAVNSARSRHRADLEGPHQCGV
jgi:hypothetical protein